MNSDSKLPLTLDDSYYTGNYITLGTKSRVNVNCINHQDKKIKFYTDHPRIENKLIGLCSKCAVKAAMQGIPVEEMLNNQQ